MWKQLYTLGLTYNLLFFCKHHLLFDSDLATPFLLSSFFSIISYWLTVLIQLILTELSFFAWCCRSAERAHSNNCFSSVLPTQDCFIIHFLGVNLYYSVFCYDTVAVSIPFRVVLRNVIILGFATVFLFYFFASFIEI